MLVQVTIGKQKEELQLKGKQKADLMVNQKAQPIGNQKKHYTVPLGGMLESGGPSMHHLCSQFEPPAGVHPTTSELPK